MSTKKKTVIEHLDSLLDFYSNTTITDVEQLKKLFIRNLKDVRRRAEREGENNDATKNQENNSKSDIRYTSISSSG
ncbi:MAG: hypothetical protein HFJ30_09185 [Clostridia bacterium]|jgi:hypothetical protein|nr:hypothetical protein [Clostridia bacterium]